MTSLGLCAFVLLVGTVQAQASPDEPALPVTPWLETGLVDPVVELIAPRSGAFFARADSSLQRSDDAGATWRPVNLPGPPSELGWVAIDPTNHTHVVVESSGALFRSVDDARTWTKVYSLENRRVLHMSISPADGRFIYLALVGALAPNAGMGDLWFLHSADGGATFTELEKGSGTTCAMSMPVLEPHPIATQTVFRSVACVAGRTFSASLSVSIDGGGTFTPALSPQSGFPRQIVGGRGVDPQRWYARVLGDFRVGGASVYRSDDDAQTWRPILEYRTSHDAIGTATSPNVTVRALTYDPAQPDHLWVALGSDGDGVQFSPDGGETWQDAGAHELGPPSSLVLGIDARNLYLATDQGVWRQPQDAP